MTTIDYTKERKVLRGPFLFFDGSFKVEFLEPEPELNADVLIRATYIANNPLNAKGKSHPQAPPLHLHSHQIETFKVIKGGLGVTMGYGQKEVVLTPENTPFDIEPMVPHAPYPIFAKEDTVALMFAHPHAEDNPLDDMFFEHLFRYLDECYKEKKTPDPFQMLLSQHASATALIMLPSWTFLGSLRWWIPWKLQAGVAWLATKLGYSALIARSMKDQ